VQGEPRDGNGSRREVRLQINRMAVHLRRRHAGQSPTTTDAPKVAQTPTRTSMHHHFFDGRPRILLLWPC
jgi:hypothetical protein